LFYSRVTRNSSIIIMVVDLKTFELHNKKFAEYVKIEGSDRLPGRMVDEACFIYWFNGERNLYDQNGKHQNKGKTALLMKCGAYITELVNDTQYGPVEAVTIHFYPEILKKLFEHDLPESLLHPTKEILPGPILVKQDELFDKYIESLMFYFENPALVDEDIMTLKLKELILLLNKTQKHKTLQQIFQYLFSPEEHSFKETIEAHLYSNLASEDLAHLTNRSLSTFKRDFRKYYGESPARFLKNRKLEKAASLLKKTELRISDIVRDCGFSSISHFTKSFSRKYGISPTNYRLA